MRFWWEEIVNHSRRDQISFGYAAWIIKFNYLTINDNFRKNRRLEIKKHEKPKNKICQSEKQSAQITNYYLLHKQNEMKSSKHFKPSEEKGAESMAKKNTREYNGHECSMDEEGVTSDGRVERSEASASQSYLEEKNDKTELVFMLKNKEAELKDVKDALEREKKARQEQAELDWEEREHFDGLVRHRDGEIEKLSQELHQKNLKIEQLSHKLHQKNLENKKNIQLLEKRLTWVRNDLVYLVRLLDNLQVNLITLLQSNRWKMGNFLGEIPRKIIFRPQVSMPAQHLEKLLKKYNTWKDKDKNYF